MKRVIGLLGLGLIGCGDDAGPGFVVDGLPSGLRMEGEASTLLNGGGVGECSMNLVFELREEVGRTGDVISYKGIHGGELFRSVREADDSGLAFFIDVYGEIEARLVRPNKLEIDIPINATAVESRFYLNLAEFRGTIDAAGEAEGTWTCAPLDIDQDGYVDNHVFASGEWSTTPVEIEPEPPEEDGFMLND